MIEDKERWNIRHQKRPMSDNPAKILQKFLSYAKVGKALDIACGTGRNSHYLEEQGFIVDAVDLSDFALSKLKNSKNINKIEADLDIYELEKNQYDLILNMNYLNRRYFPQIKEALKEGGVVIFETFIVAHGDFENPSNPEYLLQKNELLHAFIGLDIIYYEERIDVNSRGEKVSIASLVAKKTK